MFYYPTVLHHQTGCFATIWLVATRGRKLPRRDYLKVNVLRTSDDIMSYVLERVPPVLTGGPRPRFSLYLSTQLQYGLIVVYHRQCAILLEELHTFVNQLMKQRASQKIDLDDHSRQALVLPDALTLLEETDGALDPLFGVMDVMPSPSSLLEMAKTYMKAASPKLPEITSPTAAVVAAETGPTVSSDSITLREVQPYAAPTAEFDGVDFYDQLEQTLDILLAQKDTFAGGVAELPREDVTAEEQAVEAERGGDVTRERTHELTESIAELQETPLPGEQTLLLPHEEIGLSEIPALLSGQMTPSSPPLLPPSPTSAGAQQKRRSQQSEDEYPPQVKKRRKRQLIFFDPQTQISQEELQRQIDNLLTETTEQPLPPASAHRPPAAEFFNRPCSFLPPDVLSLWERAANVRPVSGFDLQSGERGSESTDSDRGRERAAVEQERRELSPTQEHDDLAELEMAAGTVLEGSDLKLSGEISPAFSTDREGSVVSRSVSLLKDIPEEVLMPLESGNNERFLDDVDQPVRFHSLLPPEADRRIVSTLFQRLLGIVSDRMLRVEQDEPYGDIVILPLH